MKKMLKLTVRKKSKTTLRYDFSPIRLAYLKNKTKKQHILLGKQEVSYTVGENANWHMFSGGKSHIQEPFNPAYAQAYSPQYHL